MTHTDTANTWQSRGETDGRKTVLSGSHALEMTPGLEVNLVVEYDHDQHW